MFRSSEAIRYNGATVYTLLKQNNWYELEH